MSDVDKSQDKGGQMQIKSESGGQLQLKQWYIKIMTLDKIMIRYNNNLFLEQLPFEQFPLLLQSAGQRKSKIVWFITTLFSALTQNLKINGGNTK